MSIFTILKETSESTAESSLAIVPMSLSSNILNYLVIFTPSLEKKRFPFIA
jgi:hypothetical protein